MSDAIIKESGTGEPGGPGGYTGHTGHTGRTGQRGHRVRLGALSFDAATGTDCVTAMLSAIASRRGGRIHTANIEHLRLASHDPALAAYIDAADLVVADGMPIVWASTLRGRPLPGRVAGSDLVWQIAEGARTQGRSLFLTGGAPGTAALAAAALERRHPGIRIAGTSSPQLDQASRVSAFEQLSQDLHQAQPDIVLIGLPLLLARDVITTYAAAFPATWWMGVGVTFSFMAGTLPRAPRWQQRVGLEWIHRLGQEPRRLARRYARDIPTALALLAASARDRWQRPHAD